MEDEDTEREEEEAVCDAECEEDKGAWAVEDAVKVKRAVGVDKGNVWLMKRVIGRRVSKHIWERKRQMEIVWITLLHMMIELGSNSCCSSCKVKLILYLG